MQAREHPPLPPWYSTVPGVYGARIILFDEPGFVVSLDGFRVWPEGLQFELFIRYDPAGERVSQGRPSPLKGFGGSSTANLFVFGVTYSDGRSASNRDRRRRSPQRLSLSDHGASGTRGMSRAGWLLAPLPPSGPLTFWCEWPVGGLPRTSVEIDAAPLIAASAEAIPVWDSAPPGGSWSTPDQTTADGLRAEVEREIGVGHPLWGVALQPVARCAGCDDAIFRADDGRSVLIHLTWSSHIKASAWPSFVSLDTETATITALREHEH
jgi:hypothetical protein